MSFIIDSYAIDGTGKGTIVAEKDISGLIKADQLAWIHMDVNNSKTRNWLEKEVPYLDQIMVDALLADETRPRILEFDKGALLILRGVNLNEDAEPEDMVSIRLWIDQNRIISVQRRNLKAVQDIRNRLEAGTGPKNAGDFVIMLVKRLFERMEPVLNELSDRTDDIEEKIIESPDADERPLIIDLRKQAILLRRYISPQRDVIAYLRSSDQDWLDTTQKRHLQEALDRVTRYVEDLDTIRERAQIIKDELSAALSDKLNKNLIVIPINFCT